jgi:hypothetical protein
MRAGTIIWSLLLLPATVPAQALYTRFYTGVTALSRQQADVFSMLYNPASLAAASSLQAGMYSERRYQLAELSNHAAALALPTSRGNFGFQLRYAGFSGYNESQLGFAYARKLGKAVMAGMQLHHYSYQAEGSGRAGTLNSELGILMRLGHSLSLGMHVFNPVGGRFAKSGERLQPVVSLALGYDASESFFISAELKKEAREQMQFHTGFQYRFAHRFFLRGGINTATGGGLAGAGISWNRLRLDMAGSYHPQLGWSPGLLLLFGLNPAPDHP